MLADGSFVPKSSNRIESYGTCDELNAQIGLLIEIAKQQPIDRLPKEIFSRLNRIQNHLFDLGGELATPNLDPVTTRQRLVSIEDIALLEQEMDEWNEKLEPLSNFVLPGGNLLNAQAHVCRTVCRRAERVTVELSAQASIRREALVYLNRLSDWFFVCGRAISQAQGSPENLWQQKIVR
jgi:cob(I)alamin adenosyltransferase